MESTFKNYFKAFGVTWLTMMSGPLSVPLALASLYVENPLARTLMGITAIVGLVVAPYTVWKRANDKVAAFEAERTQPKLEILFEHSAPCERYSPPNPAAHAFHEYSIEIRSKWHEILRDCHVEIDRIEPPVNTFVLPIRLKQHTDKVSAGMIRSYRQSFELAPFSRIYIDVANLDEREPPMPIHFAEAFNEIIPPHTPLLPRGSYILTIKAFADIGPPAEARFALSAESQGCLQFTKL